MSVAHILVFFQTAFLSFYISDGLVTRAIGKHRLLFISLLTFLLVLVSLFSFQDEFPFLYHQMLLLLLVVGYLQDFLKYQKESWKIVVVQTIMLAFLYANIFTIFNHTLLSVASTATILLSLIIVIWFRLKILTQYKVFFLRIGFLIVLFFNLEPVLIEMQQNIKPIATIPISILINNYSLLMISGMLLLVASGYLVNEKLNRSK